MKLRMMIEETYKSLPDGYRGKFWSILALGTMAALAELLGIAAVIPIVYSLVGHGEGLIGGVVKNIFGSNAMLLAFSVSILVVASSLVQVFFEYKKNSFINSVVSIFSQRAYANHLDKPLSEFVHKPRHLMVRDVQAAGERIGRNLLGALVDLYVRVVLVGAVILVLLALNPRVALFLVAFFTLAYVMIYFLVRRRVAGISAQNFATQGVLHRLKIDAYDGVREIKVFRLLERYVSLFHSSMSMQKAQSLQLSLLGLVPKHVLEVVGLLALIGLAVSLRGEQERSALLGSLAVIAICAYRVLPAMQRIYRCFNQMTGVRSVWAGLTPYIKSSGDTRKALSQYEEACELDADASELVLSEVTYRYPEMMSPVICELSANIPLKGVVLVSGRSGSGKSTLFDLLLGLKAPDGGDVCLGKLSIYSMSDRWLRFISYAPQSPHLIGENILDIITLGEPVDQKRLDLAVEVSGVDKVFESKSGSGLSEQSIAGLSGGEMARVALARALYKQSKIVFLDEPFSALDMQSTKLIVSNMLSSYPYRCFFIISHRASELGSIDYELKL